MKTKTFIIIVTYNGIKWLSKCLKSCDTINVIVVDNNSNDGTVVFIQKNFPEIILLPQNKNLGFGAANNIGISYALKNGADYVFLLNQDAFLEPNTVTGLIEIHKKNSHYGILSPIHLNGAGTKLDFYFSKYMYENKKLQYDAIKKHFSKHIYEVPFINAAAWLLPKNTLEKIGGFDPIFFHLGEDDNYCQRVLYHKLKIGVVPEVYVLHDREYRLKSKPINKIEKLVRVERSNKIKWCNINVEIEKDIAETKQALLKTIIKSFLILKFSRAFFYINKYFLINRILPEIKKSREKNKEPGLNYLDY